MSQENVETVRRLLDAFASRDLEAIIAENHPDVEIIALRSGIEGPYLGHDGLRRWGAELIEQAPDFVMHIEEVRDCGDRVLVVGRQRGTVSGVPFDHVLATVFEFEAGKVSRMEAFPTAEGALEAVGLRA